jgi:hypothetical protein
LWFPLDVRHCSKMSSLQFHFQFGKQIEIKGCQGWLVGRWGTITMLLVENSVVFRDMWVGVLSWWSQLWLHQSSSLFIGHFLSSASKRHSKSQSWT